ncbi:hypothetical protein [Coleofasciculus sp. FACHB-SPT9]|uniref:hypothetical protein n=1 Tax=Coleofasciculus sp. FACHB-SPT9 TaxID=2692791 RepID=UPI00403FB5B2
MNGNNSCGLMRSPLSSSPYSLGKLIEWKRFDCYIHTSTIHSPYSLGKLVEWKLKSCSRIRKGKECRLYSLGKLIEWKPLSPARHGWSARGAVSLLAREIN